MHIMSVPVVYDDASLSRYIMAPVRSLRLPILFSGGALCMISTRCGCSVLSLRDISDSVYLKLSAPSQTGYGRPTLG